MGPALCQLRGRGGGHPGEVGVVPARPGPGKGGRQRLRAGAGSARVRAPASPPRCCWGQAGRRVRAAWGALGGRALGEPSLSLGAGLTRNWEPDEGGSTSVPLLSLASELQAQPVMPPSPGTPATQAAAVDIFHSPFEEGVRGAQPMMGTKGSRALFPAQPSERIQSLWENRAKGKEMEVRGNRG